MILNKKANEHKKLYLVTYIRISMNGRKDYLFALRQELEMYELFQLKIQQCDVEIEKFLTDTIDNDPDKKQHFIENKPYKKANKNAPKNIDLNLFSYQYFEGVDLMAIEENRFLVCSYMWIGFRSTDKPKAAAIR